MPGLWNMCPRLNIRAELRPFHGGHQSCQLVRGKDGIEPKICNITSEWLDPYWVECIITEYTMVNWHAFEKINLA